MNRREILLKCHVRNEEFVRELWPILTLGVAGYFQFLLGMWFFTYDTEEGRRIGWELLRAAVQTLKKMADQLHVLIEKWPRAEWLFFREGGTRDRYRILRQFYTKTYPAFFPGEPVRVPWKSCSRITGNIWCGSPVRFRKETGEALATWDLFKAGQNPVKIARCQFPAKKFPGMRLGAKLMAVLRRLNRAHQLIYGIGLPRNRRTRRLATFNPQNHAITCPQCRNATTIEQMCATASDFVKQDMICLKERLVEM